MQDIQAKVELFEMAALNSDSLLGKEKTSILKARLALEMFMRAMQAFLAEDKKKEAAA